MTGSRFPWLRWAVPAVAVLTMTTGAALVKAISASADPPLPPRTAAQLLVDLQTARVDGLSGTVTQRADLGIPALPGMGDRGSSDLTSLVSGSHTLRVWYSGPDSARVALLGTLGESDIITNGKDVWIWSSRDNTATHRVITPKTNSGVPVDPSDLPKSPQDAANAVLAAVDPSTVVTTAGSARVAGRAAYELVLAPRDSSSLISRVTIAIDAEQHVPLRVRVYPAQGADPAVEVAFTQVSFTRPGAEQFQFNPPPGAKVTEETDSPASEKPTSPDSKVDSKPSGAVIGKGWTTVLVGKAPAAESSGNPLAALLGNLPAVSGTWGSGHLLSGKLFSALLTDDGRILVGAVSPQRLYEAAADPAAALKG